MSETTDGLVAAVSDVASPLPDGADLTAADLPDALRSQLADAAVVGLGESSHGTQEFSEFGRHLVRVLVEDFDARAVAFEAPFHQFARLDERVAAADADDVRALRAEMDGYRPMRSEPIVDLLEWVASYNDSRPPEDRAHVYGFDTTIMQDAVVGVAPYLDAVDADVNASVRDALDAMADGYDSEDERQEVLDAAREALAALQPQFEANEAAWVEATSRQAYDRVRHRLRLVETQVDAHGRDHAGRRALRDEAMAANVEWIEDRSTGPIVIWGANDHLSRGSMSNDEWEFEWRAMGEYLADAFGDRYCPIGFDTAAGTVAAKDGAVDEIAEYAIPDPPAGSILDVLARVDEPALWLSVDALHDDPRVREWLQTEPRLHKIWGGHPDGDNPVRYQESDLGEFDWLVFVRETSPLVHLD